MVVHNATPLIALDAVVIDTETTGLDPAEARILEIAAIGIVDSYPYRHRVTSCTRRQSS